ncbi:MAG: methionine--tRNA ligase [Patescibacteria group bacterium]
MSNKFYITTPIYYVNDVPHIGHTYTTVAADVLARFHRMIGENTFFLTGTDEHGAKIEEMAKKSKKSSAEFTNEISAKFKIAWDELDISYNNFIRTTDPNHKKAVQNALSYMYKKGDIYKGKYKGLYCRGCEQYKSKRDLVNGKCPEHNKKPEMISETCYMFKLSKYKKELLNKIKKDQIKIRPLERKKEIVNFYEKKGLSDISFSRENVKWGIPLPWDKSQTAYVWAEAFLNYLPGLGWSGPRSGLTDSEAVKPLVKNFWPPDLQLMSKDILRVHATIWPAMLLSLGLQLPKQIFVHGYFLINNQKMSKSLKNVISPEELIKKYGVDGTRYLLMSATSFGHDGDINWEWFDKKYNADLANGIGNLMARSATLAEKMQKSCLPADKTNIKNQISKIKKNIIWDNYKNNFKEIKIDKVLELINKEIKEVDSYITKEKPWELIKNKDKRSGIIIYNILEQLRLLAWMLWPIMPETAEKIWQQLGLNMQEELKKDFKKAIKWGGLEIDIKVKKGKVLFPRITNLN